MSPKIAFVFPGQGSQAVGMLNALAAQFPIVKQTFAEASEKLGYDLWQLAEQGPADTLNQTIHTQPALLAASVAIWRVWLQQGGQSPAYMAGHSLGEYSALVCAGVFDFSTAIKLVADRGKFMQEAVPAGQGAMVAIVGLDDAKIIELCKQAAQDQIIAPANFNAVGQVVVAGQTEAIDRIIILAQQAGAKLVKRVAMSVPSHCALMQSAADRLAKSLAAVSGQAPKIPVINNVDVAINNDMMAIKNALTRQLYNPVRWVEIIQLLAMQGVELIIECGPGKVLAGLNKRIVASVPTLSINDPENLAEARR